MKYPLLNCTFKDKNIIKNYIEIYPNLAETYDSDVLYKYKVKNPGIITQNIDNNKEWLRIEEIYFNYLNDLKYLVEFKFNFLRNYLGKTCDNINSHLKILYNCDANIINTQKDDIMYSKNYNNKNLCSGV